MHLRKIQFILLVISVSLASCKVQKQDQADYIPTEIAIGNKKTVTDITEDDIRTHISILASDSMRGRKSASPDEALAAEYIKEKFESLGLKSFNNNYYQAFPVTSRKTFNNCELYFDDFKGEYPSDFRSMIMFDSITVTGEVVFAGYGNESDYNNLNVKGKWVLLLEADNSILYEMKATAKANGALGVLAVGKDGTSGNERYVLASDSVPLIRISHNLSNRLFAYSDLTVQEILEKAKTGNMQNINISIPVTATIASETRVISSSQNVVSYLETNEPEQGNGYIVIGAHYDHIGVQTRSDSLYIFNGADDNASGTAGLLEIAEKLCSDNNLKYNFLFAAFGSEELGLIGSNYFVKNSPVPLDKIKLMVNLDMIGRMDSVNHVYINTVKPDEKLNNVVDKIKKYHPDINTVFSFEDFMSGSDHTSFYTKKIPVLFFLTGIHNDYHKTSDTIEAINFKGEKLVLDFIYDLVISPEMDDCIRSFTSSDVNP